MEIPHWVSNEKKYERAVSELKKNSLAVTEEAVKALYVKFGGLVLTEEIVAEMEEKKEVIGFKRSSKKK